MNNHFAEMLMQIVWQSPVMLAYVVAMVVAVVNWSNYPKPSLLTFAGCGLLLALVVIHTVLQAAMIAQPDNLGIARDQIGTALRVLALVMNLFRVAAVGMLVMAVYSGRAPAQQPWMEENA